MMSVSMRAVVTMMVPWAVVVPRATMMPMPMVTMAMAMMVVPRAVVWGRVVVSAMHVTYIAPPITMDRWSMKDVMWRMRSPLLVKMRLRDQSLLLGYSHGIVMSVTLHWAYALRVVQVV